MGKKSKKDELKVSEIVEQEAIIEQHCQEQAINNQNPCEQEEVFDKEYNTKEEKKYAKYLKPHFDIAQKQILIWNDYEDLTKQLCEWIKALF